MGLALVGPYGLTGVAVATAVGRALEAVSLWLAAKFTTGMYTHVGPLAFIKLAKKVREGGW